MVNLGGGFPMRYRDEVPEIDAFGIAIMRAMTEHFGNDLPEMLIEPGRFIVGDAGVVSAEVVLVSRRDQGRSGALGVSRHRPLRRAGGDRGRGDQLPHHHAARRRRDGSGGDRRPDLRRRGHHVRAATTACRWRCACGDRVELLSTGAYVTTYASQRFNGFAPLAEHYI